MNFPTLRFEGFDGEWREFNFNQITNITMGQSPSGDSYNTLQHGEPLINGPTEFGNIYPTPIQWTTKPTKYSKPGDVLLCVRGSSIGRMNISDQKYCVGRGVAAISGLENKTTSKYLKFVLEKEVEKILKRSTGSTFPNISGHELKQSLVSIPNLQEQQKIAFFFSSLDQKIEKQQEKIEKLEELKKGMMQKIFSRDVRFKDENDRKFPDWESFMFRNVVSNKSDKVIPEDGSDLNMCIELENIESGSGRLIKDTNYVDQTSMKNKFSRGSVLFGKLRPYLKKFWFSDSEGMCSTEIWVLSPRVSNLKKKFLYYFIQSEYFMKYANKSSGSKMPRADWNIISNIEFMIPTIKEQQKISDFFSTLDSKIENEKYKSESLKNQKKGLMQQMFI